MTVKELIHRLKEFDEDMEVVVPDDEYGSSPLVSFEFEKGRGSYVDRTYLVVSSNL